MPLTISILYVCTTLQTNMCDTVVWNPWSEKAAAMSDFGDEEYARMVCVEAVQATEPVILAKGDHYRATHVIAVKD